MPRTPDRSPGALEEDEEIRLEANAAPPTVAGAFNYNGTSFQMKDGVGVFDPRSGGGGITAGQHQTLDQLVHDIAETAYLKLTQDGNGNYTNATWWTDSGMTVKIREYDVTYDGNDDVTQVVAKQYDGAGALAATFTLPVAYVSGDPDNIAAVLT